MLFIASRILSAPGPASAFPEGAAAVGPLVLVAADVGLAAADWEGVVAPGEDGSVQPEETIAARAKRTVRIRRV
jgi:hypothetical protein